MASKMAKEEIVISGMAGTFPKSKNIAELANNLYNKVDMVGPTTPRWRVVAPNIPNRIGTISELQKFDAMFFGVHFKQVHSMDPQSRLLIEKAYEAVVDAGISPKTIRGSRTGVFVGGGWSESEQTWYYDKVSMEGFGITGCSRAMLANRISYSLGLQGMSFLLDTADSSGMYCLDVACKAIESGKCDAAIVAGCNLLLHYNTARQYGMYGLLAKDDYCRPFDDNASGYVRSETTSVLFLQKAKDAKRIYGTVVHTKSNFDGYKEEGFTHPSGEMQAKLLTEFYQEAKVDPTSVAFVEANGTAIRDADYVECKVMDEIFCKNRKEPLPIGSVKSNMGHAESAAAICSIAKVLMAYHHGKIAPNLYFSKCRQDIPALTEGRLTVVTEPTLLNGPLVAVNSFGISGANAHCLLRAHDKEKINNGLPIDNLPRLVTWSGRIESGIHEMLDDVTKQPLDVEHVALVNNVQQETTQGHVFRGFGLFEQTGSENAVCLSKEVQHFTGLKRPLVYVFSGMGSQWCEMGTSLMAIPIFRESIEKSHAVLEKRGLDLIQILTSTDKKTYDNILHSFVGIAAIQIALVDILNELELVPDYIIGHSVGELGCAYADGSLTAEQMILASYSRGMVSIESKVIFGSMAAIGLGYRKIRSMLPSDIEVACHNSPDSCTISGPAERVTEFVRELKQKNIFAKEVPCSNIAYHSRYIAGMGPKLLARLQEVIPEPKERSPKWLSSSVPKMRWDTLESKLCSAEYHTNNLLSPVLFEETSALLPTNALTIEIAPHRLLQAILKPSMPKAVHVGLTLRGAKNNAQVLLVAIGQLFNIGLEIPINKLYPQVEFPVSRGTGFLSPYIHWDHSEDWFLSTYEEQRIIKIGERKLFVDLSLPEFEYIQGHIINDRILIPASTYLHLVWETFAMFKGKTVDDLEVEMTDIMFLKQTALESKVKFSIIIQPGTGRFEISEAKNVIVTGYIKELQSTILADMPIIEQTDFPVLTSHDFYNELHYRGHNYCGEFKSVLDARADGLLGAVKWTNNWATFLDGLLQTYLVGEDTRALLLPTGIQRLVINPIEHLSMAQNNPVMAVKASRYLQLIRSGGIEICGVVSTIADCQALKGHAVLESYEFIAHMPAPKMSETEALRMIGQLALENLQVTKVKIVELDAERKECIITKLAKSLDDLPLVTTDLMLLSTKETHLDGVHVENGKLATQTNCTVIIADQCLGNAKFVQSTLLSLIAGGFLISRENSSVEEIVPPVGFQLLAMVPSDKDTFVLLQSQTRTDAGRPKVIKSTTEDYSWVLELRQAIKNGPVIVLAENERLSGIKGLVNCVRKEANGHMVTAVLIDDINAPPFELEHPLYKKQLNLGLAINVFKDGYWGSYRNCKLLPQLETRKQKDHCYVNALTAGDISSLTWLLGPFNFNRPKGELIRVQYASINTRDVLLASGKLPSEVFGTGRMDQECLLGYEYAGLSERGRRVMGMISSGALATYVEADDILTWECPEHWTLQQAATIPVAYATVYTALFIVGQISKGKSILIHAGNSDVGLAAIRVALSYGLDVFTTVGTKEEREFLLQTFPTLQPQRIGSSKDVTFENMVKLQTGGKGVNFVLNSLEDELLLASIRCVAKDGKLLEIGKFDITQNTNIGLGQFLRAISFQAVIVENILTARAEEKETLRQIIEKDIKSGIIVPLQATLFPANDVEKAFRYLGGGRNIGKVMLQVRELENNDASLPLTIMPRSYCTSKNSYIVCGVHDTFGLELADWLIVRGCRKLVINTKDEAFQQYLALRIKLWKSYGVDVVVSSANIMSKFGCKTLLTEASTLGAVSGIFALSLTGANVDFQNLDETSLENAVKSRAVPIRLLDEVSRKICTQLQHFVVFTNTTSSRGVVGQSSDGLTNSIIEQIINQRYENGLPAKAIQWAAIDCFENTVSVEKGTLKQKVGTCLKELDLLLDASQAIVCSMLVEEKRKLTSSQLISSMVMNIMNLTEKEGVNQDTSLMELGLDNLMAAEIKQTLDRLLGLIFTTKDVEHLTFGRLQELFADEEADITQVKLKQASGETPVTIPALLKNLSSEGRSDNALVRLESENNSLQYSCCVLIMPGIEGVLNSTWEDIALSLSIPTFGLQLTAPVEGSSMQEITTDLMDRVKAHVFKQTGFFYLVGYSYGAFATLELARAMEATGKSGHVVLIDGAPEFLQKLTARQVGNNYNDEVLQLNLFADIVRSIVPMVDVKVLKQILKITSWQERVDAVVKLTKNQEQFPERCVRGLINSVFNRIKIALNTDITTFTPLRSPITLIRPTQISITDISEDYGLSRYTEDKVTLKFVEGDHMTILDNPQIKEIITESDPFLQSNMRFKKYIEEPMFKE